MYLYSFAANIVPKLLIDFVVEGLRLLNKVHQFALYVHELRRTAHQHVVLYPYESCNWK